VAAAAIAKRAGPIAISSMRTASTHLAHQCGVKEASLKTAAFFSFLYESLHDTVVEHRAGSERSAPAASAAVSRRGIGQTQSLQREASAESGKRQRAESGAMSSVAAWSQRPDDPRTFHPGPRRRHRR